MNSVSQADVQAVPAKPRSTALIAQAARWIIPSALLCYGLSTLQQVIPSVVVGSTSYLVQENWLDGSGPKAFDIAIARNDIRANLVRDMVGLLRMSVFGQTRPGVIIGKEGWMFNSDDWAVLNKKGGEIATAVGKVLAAAEILERHGSQVVMVFVPAKSEVKADYLGTPDLFEALRSARLEFKSGLEASGISVIDPTEAILNGAQGDVGIKTDQHWSPYGAQLAAKYIAAELDWPAYQQGISAVPGPLEVYHGDLSSAIGSQAAVDMSGILPELGHKYAAEDASGEVIDPDWTDVDTVLVGTSASSNPQWGFAAALSQSLQMPIANLSVSGAGPMYPMNEALALFERAQRYPKQVIWEFTLPSLFLPSHMGGTTGSTPEPWL